MPPEPFLPPPVELPPSTPDTPAAPETPPAAPAGPPRWGVGERLRLGLRLGAIAAAATAGALVGFGLREGTPLRPFAAGGRAILDLAAADRGAARLLATLTGLAGHILAVSVWAVLLALVAARWRGWRLAAAAVAVSAAAYLANRLPLPPLLRLGDDPMAFALQRAILYVVLALALGFGMRVALTRRDVE